jgi:mercuric reductase
VNVGCVPSKTLLYAGEVLYHVKHHGILGIELEVQNFDFKKVVQDEIALVEKLRKEKYEKVLKNLEHVTTMEGKATFVSENEVEVHPSTDSRQDGKKLSADKFIIAAGSTAHVPPIEGIRETGFVTHIEALCLEKTAEKFSCCWRGPAWPRVWA